MRIEHYEKVRSMVLFLVGKKRVPYRGAVLGV